MKLSIIFVPVCVLFIAFVMSWVAVTISIHPLILFSISTIAGIAIGTYAGNDDD